MAPAACAKMGGVSPTVPMSTEPEPSASSSGGPNWNSTHLIGLDPERLQRLLERLLLAGGGEDAAAFLIAHAELLRGVLREGTSAEGEGGKAGGSGENLTSGDHGCVADGCGPETLRGGRQACGVERRRRVPSPDFRPAGHENGRCEQPSAQKAGQPLRIQIRMHSWLGMGLPRVLRHRRASGAATPQQSGGEHPAPSI